MQKLEKSQTTTCLLENEVKTQTLNQTQADFSAPQMAEKTSPQSQPQNTTTTQNRDALFDKMMEIDRQNQAQKLMQTKQADETVEQIQTDAKNDVSPQNVKACLKKPRKQQEPRAKDKKGRIKFFCVVLAICLAFSAGLFVHNSVKISNLQSSITSAQTEYNVNIYKYIKKINKLEKIEDYIESAESVENTSFIPISIPKSEREKLDKNAKVKTNWFDQLVEKIRTFFGK